MTRKFDELNELHSGRMVDFGEYFSVMEIPAARKEKRVRLAERLEDDFLYWLALIALQLHYLGNAQWESIQDGIEGAYLAAIGGFMDVDGHLSDHAKAFAANAIESTQRNIGDEYTLSVDRASYMAANESNGAWGYDDFREAVKGGKTEKEWHTMRDERVRDMHRDADGQRVGIYEPFLVGGEYLDFPGDGSYGASPENLCGCRCTVRYY